MNFLEVIILSFILSLIAWHGVKMGRELLTEIKSKLEVEHERD